MTAFNAGGGAKPPSFPLTLRPPAMADIQAQEQEEAEWGELTTQGQRTAAVSVGGAAVSVRVAAVGVGGAAVWQREQSMRGSMQTGFHSLSSRLSVESCSFHHIVVPAGVACVS